MMAKRTDRKKGSGGARPGSGRKAGVVREPGMNKVRVAYKLAPEVVDILAEIAATGKMSRAAAIEYAVAQVFGSVFGPGSK